MRAFKVGDRVTYSPVIGGETDGKVYTVEAFGELQSGDSVAWLVGKTGCVSVNALGAAAPVIAAKRAAYLSGVRAGLEAARPVVAKAYRDGLSDGCEDASTIANATPLDMEYCGNGYARRVVFPSAESIAKEAEK